MRARTQLAVVTLVRRDTNKNIPRKRATCLYMRGMTYVHLVSRLDPDGRRRVAYLRTAYARNRRDDQQTVTMESVVVVFGEA